MDFIPFFIYLRLPGLGVLCPLLVSNLFPHPPSASGKIRPVNWPGFQ